MVNEVGTPAGKPLARLIVKVPTGTVITTGDQVPAGAAGFRLTQVAGAATAVQV